MFDEVSNLYYVILVARTNCLVEKFSKLGTIIGDMDDNTISTIRHWCRAHVFI